MQPERTGDGSREREERRERENARLLLIAEPMFAEAVAQGMHAPFGLNCDYWGREYASRLLDAFREDVADTGTEV